MALNQIDPWGDDRADLREAFNTLAAVGGDNPDALIDSLIGYLRINRRETIAGPDAVRQMMGG